MMRKILFLLVAVLAVSCSTTPEERAERLVRDYLEQTADDPSSVQDIDIGILVDDTVRSRNDYPVPVKYASVSYRARNLQGVLVRESGIVVRFDNDVTAIQCFDCFAE